MKQILIAIAILVVAVGIGLGGHIYSLHERLGGKADRVKAEMEDWIEHGYDPGAAIILLKQVPDALTHGDLEEAERLIDKASADLDVPPNKRPKPHPAPGEESSDLYGNAKPVEIEGYDGSSMEPFISPDGHYLFFNNENDPDAQTDLHVAERTGPYKFKYLGKLKNANSSALDAVASMDKAKNFYFTSTREYQKTFKSIFTGKFDGRDIAGVHPVEGDINPNKLGTVNMDVGISPDGNTLYISRADFTPGLNGPDHSRLMVAHLKDDGKFVMDPKSDEIMKNINNDQLQYAPAISQDGRELFFTRSQAPEGKLEGPQFRIMVALRAADGQIFGKPKVLPFTGMVEAPTVSLDESEMFFHKKVDGKWVIYRALRKGAH